MINMSKKILVIDDDIDILTILEIILGDEGFELELRQKGLSSEEVNIIHPDLILLDVRIRGFAKSGVEICTEFKSDTNTAHIPVLLVSSENNLDSLARNCGADGFVNKPFDFERIIKKVREFVY